MVEMKVAQVRLLKHQKHRPLSTAVTVGGILFASLKYFALGGAIKDVSTPSGDLLPTGSGEAIFEYSTLIVEAWAAQKKSCLIQFSELQCRQSVVRKTLRVQTGKPFPAKDREHFDHRRLCSTCGSEF